jgi:hypothetical protein
VCGKKLVGKGKPTLCVTQILRWKLVILNEMRNLYNGDINPIYIIEITYDCILSKSFSSFSYKVIGQGKEK